MFVDRKLLLDIWRYYLGFSINPYFQRCQHPHKVDATLMPFHPTRKAPPLEEDAAAPCCVSRWTNHSQVLPQTPSAPPPEEDLRPCCVRLWRSRAREGGTSRLRSRLASTEHSKDEGLPPAGAQISKNNLLSTNIYFQTVTS